MRHRITIEAWLVFLFSAIFELVIALSFPGTGRNEMSHGSLLGPEHLSTYFTCTVLCSPVRYHMPRTNETLSNHKALKETLFDLFIVYVLDKIMQCVMQGPFYTHGRSHLLQTLGSTDAYPQSAYVLNNAPRLQKKQSHIATWDISKDQK